MFYLLKNIIMGKKTNILTTIATATVISTTSVNADTLKDNDINKIVCTTKQSCEKLSNSIQTQIDELENKGFKNLSRAEKIKYDTLSDKLIAVENQKQEKQKITIAEENQKQEIEDKKHLVQNKIIAEENKKQETQDKIHQNQEIQKKVNQEQIKEQLTSIKGSFL